MMDERLREGLPVMAAPTAASLRPRGATILAAISVLGAVGSIPVVLGLLLGVIEPASIGLGSTGLSAPATALTLVAYIAFALIFAYGLWTLQPWGWWFALVFFAGSAVSDLMAAIAGWQPPLTSAALVAVAIVLLVWWLRPSVRAAFRVRA
jgi:uncharacterized membrane protein (DUF2068 family)